MMSTSTTVGASFLEGFLRIMVIALVLILIAIPLCMVLDLLGVFKTLGLTF